MSARPDEHDDDGDAFDPSFGCSFCDTSGWNHGCVDDMCRHCAEPDECPDARPCSTCNKEGVIW